MAAIKTQTVPALDRALSILELIARSRAGLTLPELVEQSKLPRSSVHYLLVTLERRGYLQRNERTSRYLFGMNLIHLANAAVNGLSLRQQAAPHLQSLMRRTQLTVHMGILQEKEAVLIAKLEPPQGLRLATWVGKRMDVHCTGLGKALIAHLPPSELDRLIREHGLPRHNENTIFSARKLKDELDRVVRLGFAYDDEEDELGSRCVGAPVLDAHGRAIAAVSVAGSASEINRTNLETLAREIKSAATAISQALCESEREWRNSLGMVAAAAAASAAQRAS
jgi:DNA-binding IclR family transcriptional regulator